MVTWKRTRFMDELMNETTLYGGLPMRRCDVFTLATEHLGEHAYKLFGADYFAMRPAAVPLEPLPLDVARRICAGKGTEGDNAMFAACCGLEVA